MDVKKYPNVEVSKDGRNQFIYSEFKIWRGEEGGISIHKDSAGVIANVPKDSKLYEQLERLFEGGQKIGKIDRRRKKGNQAHDNDTL